jgi:hypothetical protein
MKLSRMLAFSTLLLAAAFFAGCSEEDLNSLRIELNADGTGQLVLLETRVMDNAGTTVANTLRGMDWGEKGMLLTARTATFKKVEHLDVAGIKMTLLEKHFRMTVPMGADAKWAAVLAPDQAGSEDVRKKARELGLSVSATGTRTFKFVLKVPGEVVAKGAVPKITQTSEIIPRGGEAADIAELVLPIEKILKSPEKELTWEVTWK